MKQAKTPRMTYDIYMIHSMVCEWKAWKARGRPVEGLPLLDLAATEGKGAVWEVRATVRHLRVCLSV